MRRWSGGAFGVRLLLVIPWVAAVAGCYSGRPPAPSPPTTTLGPDIVSLAAALDGDSRECDVVLTLESGDRLSLGGEFVSAWCTAVPPTPLLFGYRDDVLDNKGWSGGEETSPSLIVSGLDGDVRWIGIAVHNPHLDTPAPDPCYHLYLGRANGAHGAWLEGDRVHLDNGPVLPLSPGFRMNTNYPEPWPLRGSDYLCLDVEGRVTYATTPAGS